LHFSKVYAGAPPDGRRDLEPGGVTGMRPAGSEGPRQGREQARAIGYIGAGFAGLLL
jgi:hypothetical protein